MHSVPAVRDRRPLALQVRDEIRELISERALGPGDQLPGEAELASLFGVARTTVREALKLLEQDGRIDVRHGVGRFIAPASVQWPITRLESVTEMMQAMGTSVTNRIVTVAMATATDHEAAALRVAVGAPVVRLERIRSVDGRAVIYSIDVILASVVDDDFAAIDWSGSLQALLRARGAAMASSVAGLRAVTLPRTVAAVMGEDSHAPWLLMIQTHFTPTGRAVLYSHDYHRGDAFTFNVPRRADGAAGQ
jgi:GntR family transcriptional regulator